MYHHKYKKILLFIEPNRSSQNLIYRARINGYRTIIISLHDTYLTLPKQTLEDSFIFFQIKVLNHKSIFRLIKDIDEKFKIDGVIPTNKDYGGLTANTAKYLKVPGLKPEIAFKIQDEVFFSYFLTKKKRISEYNEDQEYKIEGLINNKIAHIFCFIENNLFAEGECLGLGYIVRAEIDPISFKSIYTFLQEMISSLELDYGFFCAKIKISKSRLALIEFAIGLAEEPIPTFIKYATGIDYYHNIFRLFSSQTLSLPRTSKLNLGIISFCEKNKNHKELNEYIKKFAKKGIILKSLENKGDDIQSLSIDMLNSRYLVLMHQDYEILKHEIKRIEKISKFKLN